MPFYLQRVRFTVHTKKQFLAGTNSLVKLCYKIEENYLHPKLGPGVHSTDLDHPYHDDFQSGKSDSYEVDFGSGRLGKAFQGHPVLNGLQFDTLDDAKKMQFHLRIEGNDQWIFDRYALGGFFMEVRPVAGKAGEYEEVELGWVEMAKHSGDVAMSSDPNEGDDEHPIALNGSFA
jgi:hypothetical protein